MINVFPVPRKATSNLSQSHGHLNFAKDDQIQALLSTSLDHKRQSSLIEGEDRSQKAAERVVSDGSHHRIPGIDTAVSLLSSGSMVSLDGMASFGYEINSDEVWLYELKTMLHFNRPVYVPCLFVHLPTFIAFDQ